MKLKFTADKKSWIKFGAFCGGLLYLVSVIILNAESFATKGEVYGLLPFKAFDSKHLLITLFFFVAGVFAMLYTTESKFFEREKGMGISTVKKSKDGYSRWADEKEIRSELKVIDPKAETLKYAGVAMISNGKKMWVDNGEAHTLVMGATGSGKTVIVSKPMIKILAKASESMIVTDPKGELYEATGNILREKGYNIIVLNFRNPQQGNAWNPMSLPYKLYKEGNTDKGTELLDDLAKNILYDEKSSNDPFWEGSASDYFTGLALGLFDDANEDQINLNSMNLMSSLGEERFGGPNNNYIKEYFNGKDPSKPAYINASGTVFAPEDTKGGVISTFKQKVKIFSTRDNLSEMLSYSDFDMKDIGRKKTAVFIIVQDEKKTLHPLATIFLKQCYETLIDVAQESGGKLPYRTNFILDEFANMPPLKDVTTMVTAARSRLIRFTFIIQNLAQLTKVYGKEDAETIRGNCNMIYLISTELAALKEISELCGEIKSKDKEKTSSRPLITVSDLQRLKQFEIIINRLRIMPYKTKFVPDFKIDWGKKYPQADYIERPKKEIALFDVRDFVKAKKQEKMKNDPNGNNMPNPFGGTSNPFGGTANPFSGMANPFGGMANMIGDNTSSMLNNPTPKTKPTSIDEIIKQIDNKISMIDDNDDSIFSPSEEVPQDVSSKPSIINNSPKDLPFFNTTPDSSQPSDNMPSSSPPTNNNNTNNNDDQFFDDFFSDE